MSTKRTLVVTAVLGLVFGSVAAVSAQRTELVSLPMAQYVGFGHNIQAENDIYMAEEEAREAIVEECMQDAGFVYWPEAGAGVINVPGNTSARGIGLAESLRDDPAPVARKDLSPTDAYVEQLAAGERDVYLTALHGEDWDSVSQSPEAFSGSCKAKAFDEVTTLAQAMRSLRDVYATQVEDQVVRQPGVVAATKEWSGCMSDAGYDYGQPSDMFGSLDDKAADLIAAWGSAIPSDKIDALEEIEVATIDTFESCNIGLARALFEARTELEQRFVEAYRDDLEVLRRDRWVGVKQP
ncbi:hypothetical protein MNBD_ACTINO02-252 [hydrothermal vent metagenome]|uniref:Uncharacterized protein n=1 Tax=hydrothermal vent metagenome TaxID=652676 RepID=A0A3B0S5R5_9ZZZZ